MTAGDVFAVLARERAVVDGKYHRQCRFVDIDRGQCFRMFRIGDGLADVDVFETGDRDDVAHLRVVRFHARQTVVRVQTADFILAHLIAVHDRDRLTVTDETAYDTTDGDFADVIIVIQRRNHDLQRRFHVAFRRRNVIQKRLEKRLDTVAAVIH